MRRPEQVSVRHGRSRLIEIILLCVGGALATCARAEGGGREADRSFECALGLQQEWREALSVGDVRPTVHGLAGARLEFAYGWRDAWDISLGGQFVGARDEYAGLGTSGSLDEVAWGVRLGADRALRRSQSDVVKLGMGVDYGELRSWLKSSAANSAGPWNYFVGLSLRAEADHAVGGSWSVYGEILTGFHLNRATGVATATEHRWGSNSVAVAVGVKLRVGGGAAEQ